MFVIVNCHRYYTIDHLPACSIPPRTSREREREICYFNNNMLYGTCTVCFFGFIHLFRFNILKYKATVAQFKAEIFKISVALISEEGNLKKHTVLFSDWSELLRFCDETYVHLLC